MTAPALKGKRILFGVFFAFFFLAAPMSAGTAIAGSADEAVQAVERHYRVLKDLTAKMVQKNHLKAVGRTQTFEGTLFIKRPGMLKLEYTNGQMILIDGKDALFYSKKSEQVIKKTFTDFAHLNIPVAFLLGAGHIRDDFDVLQPDSKAPGRLELVPKNSSAAMKKLVFDSDADGRIVALTIVDRAGNVTEIAFSDVQENTGLGDKLFAFKPPKGTEILEQ